MDNKQYEEAIKAEKSQIMTQLEYIENIKLFFNSQAGQFLLSNLIHIKKELLDELINKADKDSFTTIQSDIKAMVKFENEILFLEQVEQSLQSKLMQLTQNFNY